MIVKLANRFVDSYEFTNLEGKNEWNHVYNRFLGQKKKEFYVNRYLLLCFFFEKNHELNKI